MDNDALVAALGRDAVAAVHGYRLSVISEAERRGLRLVSDTPPRLVPGSTDTVSDPIDIRLTFLHCRGHADLAGRTLRWSPAHGWSLSHRTANAPLCYYIGRETSPLLLVPPASDVVRWATGELDGRAAPPVGVELDDDPEAIQRLLAHLDPQRRQAEADPSVPAAPHAW